MLRPNDRIEKYEIRERIATGGMGTLYLAYDTTLDRTVALKLFHGDLNRPSAREDFRREARVVAALDHPNIVVIYDSGEYLSQASLVMEYIRGETLADLIRRTPRDIALIVRLGWMVELCAAVASAHAKGIIHRDLKPANLMIDSYGRLKVLDFGIARMRGSVASHNTARLATPGYVAPEQMRGGEVDIRSDVFSIGVVCYELFSYTEAFGGDTEHATTHRVLHEDPLALDVVEPRVDGELAGIVHKALARDATMRFQSAELLRDALSAVRRRLESAEPETIATPYVPPAATGATISPSRPTTGSLATGTPSAPVTPRRSTREVLERQVQDLMALAREHQAAGDVTEAREGCLQALRLLPDNADAQQLLRDIDGPAAPLASSVLPPSNVAGVDQGPAAATPRVASGRADDATVLASSGLRVPAVTSAPTAPFAPVVPPGAAASPAATVPPAATSAAVVAAPPAVAQPVVAPDPSPAEVPVRPDAPTWGPWPRIGRSRAVLAAVAGLVVMVGAVAVWLATRPAAPVPLVPLIVDAAPWATVTAVARADGRREALPPEASTPLTLTLAPGAYRVTLVGPPPESESREVSVNIAAASDSSRVFEQFAHISPDDYFRRYAALANTSSATAAPEKTP